MSPHDREIAKIERYAKLLELEMDRLDGHTRGIDINEYHRDIRKLSANHGTCPWAPELGAMSTYIVRCVQQVISRRLEQDRKTSRFVSAIVVDDESGDILDTAETLPSRTDAVDDLLHVRDTWTVLGDTYGDDLATVATATTWRSTDLSVGRYYQIQHAIKAAFSR